MKKTIFNEKSIQKISSPEQIDDYIHIIRPGAWIFLAGVTLLVLAGLIWVFVMVENPLSFLLG